MTAGIPPYERSFPCNSATSFDAFRYNVFVAEGARCAAYLRFHEQRLQ